MQEDIEDIQQKTCQILENSNVGNKYKLEVEWLESSLAERDLGGAG